MPQFNRRRVSFSTVLLTLPILALASAPATAQQAAVTLEADAILQPSTPVSTQFHFGTSHSADGHTVGINNQFLTYDGKPWLPVMGEFHYARVPVADWETEIEKMKASGLDIIATYVVWNYHEERPGQFNFSGDRDLRHFIELAKKHQMKVVLRLGPWAHGEVRFGGTPDWVVQQMPARRNDVVYMSYVKRYWRQVFTQVKGLQFKDGGPVIGVQLENEYNLSGRGQGAEHITALKSLAREIGFDTPLYTVTGWDGALYPKGEVVPVFAGYPDEPWGVTATKSAPNEVYAFRFTSRVAGNAGAQTKAANAGTAVEDMPNTPFLGAEYAGGLPIMYRRRPLVQPSDIGAMLPVQLGSGANLYGYYMYHGGRNPVGDTSLEESALQGDFNDMPLINYDFQAPFGQYGEPHDVLGIIRPFHLFLNAFGERLAPMAVHQPLTASKGPDDLQTPRYSVRSLGESGFVFLNNYVRQYAMAEQHGVQFQVDLPSGKLLFPSKPVTVGSGAYFVWPFNFDLDGVNLTWASAQPVTRLVTPDGAVTYVFEAQDGVQPEFAFDGMGIADLKAASGRVEERDGHALVNDVMPGRGVAISFRRKGRPVSIVVLSSDDAKMLSTATIASTRHLVISKDLVFGDDDLHFRSVGDPHFEFGIFPALNVAPKASLSLREAGKSGVFQTFVTDVPRVNISATLTKVRDALTVPPINIGGPGHAALEPYPETFGKAAAWSISLSDTSLKGVSNAYLKISYKGDVARLFAGADLLDDDFWYGPDWMVGLKQLAPSLKAPLTLTVLPLRADAPIYIDERYRFDFGGASQVAAVTSVEVVPEYEMTLKAVGAATKHKRH